MIDETTHLKLAVEAACQSLGPGADTVILSLKSGYLYTCNETTAAMIDLADGQRTLGEIVDRLVERYDVPRATLLADLTAVASKLLGEGLMVIAD